MKVIARLLLLILLVVSGQNAHLFGASLTASGPITISGQNGTVISGLSITNPTGDCVTINSSNNITIQNSVIGPCGGNGIRISGGGSIYIYDNYIHPEITSSTRKTCCDNHDGLFADSTSNLTVQGNVIAYGEANIEIGNVNTATIVGNFLLNPIDSDPSQSADGQSRGQNFQAWSNNSNVTIRNNYALSSTDTSLYRYPENQEDSINFGLTNGITVSGNYIRGGHSPSGCGIIADDTANNAQFVNNTLVDTGQCGIGIADGTNQQVESNRVLNRTPVSGGGNVAIYVWKQYNSACGQVTVSNNTAVEVLSDGSYNSYWNGGGCGTVTLTSNTFGQTADATLEPIDSKDPAPAIPPQPFACAAASPYTNNASVPACGGGGTGSGGGTTGNGGGTTGSAPVITSSSTDSGRVGVALSYQITATNNPTNFNAIGLPAGLTVNKSSGLISGTPSAAGTYKVALSASNAAGSGTATLTVNVSRRSRR